MKGKPHIRIGGGIISWGLFFLGECIYNDKLSSYNCFSCIPWVLVCCAFIFFCLKLCFYFLLNCSLIHWFLKKVVQFPFVNFLALLLLLILILYNGGWKDTWFYFNFLNLLRLFCGLTYVFYKMFHVYLRKMSIHHHWKKCSVYVYPIWSYVQIYYFLKLILFWMTYMLLNGALKNLTITVLLFISPFNLVKLLYIFKFSNVKCMNIDPSIMFFISWDHF